MPAVRSRARRARPRAAARRQAERGWAGAARFLLPALFLLAAAPASAEPALSVSIASDDRYRGDSTSGNRPVATLAAAYDDPSGFYLGISFTAVARDGIAPLRSIQYAGYAKRLKSGVTFDIGITHRLASHYYRGEYARDVTEAYVGLSGRRLSSRIFFSPDYDGRGGASLYGEVEALLLDRGDWSVSSHVGALLPPREGAARSREVALDGRVGATRRFGRTAISLDWIAATPASDYKGWRGTLRVAVTHNF